MKDWKEDYIPIIEARTNDIDTCECGGRIVKTASGRCCEQCLADY